MAMTAILHRNAYGKKELYIITVIRRHIGVCEIYGCVWLGIWWMDVRMECMDCCMSGCPNVQG